MIYSLYRSNTASEHLEQTYVWFGAYVGAFVITLEPGAAPLEAVAAIIA